MTQVSGSSDVPDMGRRQFMNLLTFGTITGVAAGALYPVVKYFVPPSSGGSGGGIVAKDALGNDIVATEFISSHKVGDRVLSQGLKGDPTYLVIEGDNTISSYGINAVCTHLGCSPLYKPGENKDLGLEWKGGFFCPCHGSKFDLSGRVFKAMPAPSNLEVPPYYFASDTKLVVGEDKT